MLSWNSSGKVGFRENLQMELLICKYPDDVWWLLASSSALNCTVEHLTDAFAITYSDNVYDHTKEEAIVYYWYEYICECLGVLMLPNCLYFMI